jgi:hypothetical protein
VSLCVFKAPLHWKSLQLTIPELKIIDVFIQALQRKLSTAADAYRNRSNAAAFYAIQKPASG